MDLLHQVKLEELIRKLDVVEEIHSVEHLHQLRTDARDCIEQILRETRKLRLDEMHEQWNKVRDEAHTSKRSSSSESEPEEHQELDPKLKYQKWAKMSRGQNLENVMKESDEMRKQMQQRSFQARRLGEKAWRVRGPDKNLINVFIPWEARRERIRNLFPTSKEKSLEERTRLEEIKQKIRKAKEAQDIGSNPLLQRISMFTGKAASATVPQERSKSCGSESTEDDEDEIGSEENGGMMDLFRRRSQRRSISWSVEKDLWSVPEDGSDTESDSDSDSDQDPQQILQRLSVLPTHSVGAPDA